MEIISSILLAISPFLVSGLTQLLKPSEGTKLAGYRAALLRFGVALLSFASVVGTSFLSSQKVEAISVETFAQAFVVFIGATGTYFWAKYKNASASHL